MYYLVIVQNNSIPAIFSYLSYDDAVAAFHTEMAYRAEGRTSTKCLILDSNLNTHKIEVYEKSETEPNEG